MLRFAFISTGGPGWGGSEELWSRTAIELATRGHQVWASVLYEVGLPPRLTDLARAGIQLHLRFNRKTLWERMKKRFHLTELSHWSRLAQTIERLPVDLVIISEAGTWPTADLLESLTKRAIPFVTLSQVNCDAHWLVDEHRDRLRPFMKSAVRTYFVSRANLELAEHQLGCKLGNAKVISNPWTVDHRAPPDWPATDPMDQLKMACTARLHPSSKGQDLLLLALATEDWKSRSWHLTFYGDGPQRGALKSMVSRLALDRKVTFAGHVPNIKNIWAENHVLVLPSRYEGMPVALLEALICGRPAMVTAVAGNSEVVIEPRNGFVAEASMVASVQQALERLWQSRRQLREMGVNARQELLQRHPIEPSCAFADELFVVAHVAKPLCNPASSRPLHGAGGPVIHP